MLNELIGLPAPPTNRIKRLAMAHLDYETWSEGDLKKIGLSRYARHPTTEVLMCSWAREDDAVQQWVPAEDDSPLPAELEDIFFDDRIHKVAWNAQFERVITRDVLGIDVPPEQWRCMMVLSSCLSLPMNLFEASRIVELQPDQVKDARGKLLVRRFTRPRKPTKKKPHLRETHLTAPEEWQEFLEYNRQDVVAEKWFWKKCWRWNLPEHEWDLWHIDQRINDAGVPVNLATARNAVEILEDLTEDRFRKMEAITGLANANSPQQLLPWLQNNGYIYKDLKKGHIERALDALIDGGKETTDLAVVLRCRQEVARTSSKKFQTMLNTVDPDDAVIRYGFQFAGAGRTWRWAGRDIQLQNMPRPTKEFEKPESQILGVEHLTVLKASSIDLIYSNPFDLLASCIRPTIQAPDGTIFVDADLNAIENRALGWMAQDKKILGVFERDEDPYIDFARYMFQSTYAIEAQRVEDGNKDHRTISKPAVLGCGYCLGPGAEHEDEDTGEMTGTGLIGYALGMKVKLTEAEAKLAVKTWRETYTDAVDFWWRIEKAMRRCIIHQRTTECWPVRFDISGPFIRMRLPSGRDLHYCRPRLINKKTPWGGMREQITYEGKDDKKFWRRIDTHAGKITENADQAISRDVLATGIIRARQRGIDVRLHLHDQIAGLVPFRKAEKMLDVLKECMTEDIPWAPGFPLGAAGAASKYFVKD